MQKPENGTGHLNGIVIATSLQHNLHRSSISSLLPFCFDMFSSQWPDPLHVDFPQLCIINNFKGTKAAKLGPPLSSVMTNELSLRLCISLALLWPHPRERATAVPSCEQVSPNRWQGNRMEIETIGFYLSFVGATRTVWYLLESRCMHLSLY